MAESIDVESMGVEDKYDGPVLNNSTIDIQFMKVREATKKKILFLWTLFYKICSLVLLTTKPRGGGAKGLFCGFIYLNRQKI